MNLSPSLKNSLQFATTVIIIIIIAPTIPLYPETLILVSMTHYRFFYSRIVPRKREREREIQLDPSSKDEEKKEWGRKIVEIAEKRNKARNGSGVA